MSIVTATVTRGYTFVKDANGEVILTPDRMNEAAKPAVTINLANSIATADLQDDAVTGDKIASSTVVLGNMANDSVNSSKIVDNSIESGDILAATLQPGDCAVALKTKTDTMQLPLDAFGFTNNSTPATDQAYIFVAPYACTIVKIVLVESLGHAIDGTNYWTFQVRNLTAGNNLLSTAMTNNTGGSPIPTDAIYDLSADQNLTLTENDVLELQVTETNAANALTDLMCQVEYY